MLLHHLLSWNVPLKVGGYPAGSLLLLPEADLSSKYGHCSLSATVIGIGLGNGKRGDLGFQIVLCFMSQLALGSRAPPCLG